MFISTVIPTIGRSTLARAVYSVLEQGFQREECEVIVVNDSGKPLPIDDWHTLPNVKIISTNRLNRSIARNTGAAIATGRYLHFLDDDDWMLPGAFETFWETTQHTSGLTAWIHGAFSLVDNAGDKIVDVFPNESGNCLINLVSWEWLPLQASIINADAFFKIGGFAMLESLKGGFEDIHLSRQIAQEYDFMPALKLISCIRSGDNGSTTNYMNMFNQNRESREKSLDVPGAYRRLIASVNNNHQHTGYWYGRVTYYYLGSALTNLRMGRLVTSITRGINALASFCVSGSYVFSIDFWRGIVKPHYSRVWLAIKDSGVELYKNTRWI
jgi:glycosyltransferase involved in cell wall biosynthesis